LGRPDDVDVDTLVVRRRQHDPGGRFVDALGEAQRPQRVDGSFETGDGQDEVEVVVDAGDASYQRVDAPASVDDRAGNAFEDVEPFGPAASLARKEAFEDEPSRRQAAGHERGDGGRWTGDDLHRVAVGDGGPHESLAGVGDAGRARVGDDGDPLAAGEARQY